MTKSKQRAFKPVEGSDPTYHWSIDRFGRIWDLPSNGLCPTCGQPDSCGGCNHKPLKVKEVRQLGGKFACH